MKKVKVNLATTLLTGSLLLTMTGIEGKVEAAELVISKGVDVYVNDTYFVPTDVNGNEIRPFIYNGSTYLPVRAVGEAYGVEIGWDGRVLISGEANKDVKIPETNKPKVARTDVKVDAVTDVEILVNGNKFVPKDANGNEVPVILTNGTTYLPVRAISNLYGIDINWDSKTGNVYIGKHEEKNYDVKLERDSTGRYILPETKAEKDQYAGEVLRMNQHYTELLKPYENMANEKGMMISNLRVYLTTQLSKIRNGYSNDDLDVIAPLEMEAYHTLYNELVEMDNILYKISDASKSYLTLSQKYDRIAQYEDDLVYFEFCVSTAEKKEAYENIDSIMNSMNDQIYQDYINRIDNVVENINIKINGKALTR